VAADHHNHHLGHNRLHIHLRILGIRYRPGTYCALFIFTSQQFAFWQKHHRYSWASIIFVPVVQV
jgi:hypothetical protein